MRDLINRTCAIAIWSGAAIKGDIFPPRRSLVESARPHQSVVVLLFNNMSAPSGNARTDEQRRVEGSRNFHQEIGDRRIEIQVGMETFLLFHDMIDSRRNVVPSVIAAEPAQRFGVPLNDD